MMTWRVKGWGYALNKTTPRPCQIILQPVVVPPPKKKRLHTNFAVKITLHIERPTGIDLHINRVPGDVCIDSPKMSSKQTLANPISTVVASCRYEHMPVIANHVHASLVGERKNVDKGKKKKKKNHIICLPARKLVPSVIIFQELLWCAVEY